MADSLPASVREDLAALLDDMQRQIRRAQQPDYVLDWVDRLAAIVHPKEPEAASVRKE